MISEWRGKQLLIYQTQNLHTDMPRIPFKKLLKSNSNGHYTIIPETAFP